MREIGLNITLQFSVRLNLLANPLLIIGDKQILVFAELSLEAKLFMFSYFDMLFEYQYTIYRGIQRFQRTVVRVTHHVFYYFIHMSAHRQYHLSPSMSWFDTQLRTCISHPVNSNIMHLT